MAVAAVRARLEVACVPLDEQLSVATPNLALSERRAKEVLLHLTAKHDIPLHRIQLIGLGSEKPAAANETLEGRKQNRRVEVWIYTPEPTSQSASRR